MRKFYNCAIAEFEEENWLQKQQKPVNISTLLLNSLHQLKNLLKFL
jgi:hypothetical protein